MPTTSEPLLSVLMPVYNNVRFLPEALDSVLAQTYANLELIVIDDASSEPVSEVLEGYRRRDARVRPFRNRKNLGLTCSLNVAVDLAQGGCFGRIDSDDLLEPTKFERQVELMCRSGVAAVFTWAESIDEQGEITAARYEQRTRTDTQEALRILRESIKPIHSLIDPSIVYSRAVFERIGYYDEKLPIAQTYNYILRLIKFFDIELIEEPLYLRRYHSNQPRRTMRKRRRLALNRRAMKRAHTHTIIRSN